MATNRWDPAVVIARVLATIGAPLGAASVTGAVVIVQLGLRRWHAAIAVVMSVGLGALGSNTIKLISERPRPIGGVTNLSTFSFPSGHTTWAAAIAGALVLGLPRMWTWVLASAWITLMGWSRTYLGVHWLSDVAAGAMLGISIALLVDASLSLFRRRFIRLRRAPSSSPSRDSEVGPSRQFPIGPLEP